MSEALTERVASVMEAHNAAVLDAMLERIGGDPLDAASRSAVADVLFDSRLFNGRHYMLVAAFGTATGRAADHQKDCDPCQRGRICRTGREIVKLVNRACTDERNAIGRPIRGGT